MWAGGRADGAGEQAGRQVAFWAVLPPTLPKASSMSSLGQGGASAPSASRKMRTCPISLRATCMPRQLHTGHVQSGHAANRPSKLCRQGWPRGKARPREAGIVPSANHLTSSAQAWISELRFALRPPTAGGPAPKRAGSMPMPKAAHCRQNASMGGMISGRRWLTGDLPTGPADVAQSPRHVSAAAGPLFNTPKTGFSNAQNRRWPPGTLC